MSMFTIFPVVSLITTLLTAHFRTLNDFSGAPLGGSEAADVEALKVEKGNQIILPETVMDEIHFAPVTANDYFRNYMAIGSVSLPLVSPEMTYEEPFAYIPLTEEALQQQMARHLGDTWIPEAVWTDFKTVEAAGWNPFSLDAQAAVVPPLFSDLASTAIVLPITPSIPFTQSIHPFRLKSIPKAIDDAQQFLQMIQ